MSLINQMLKDLDHRRRNNRADQYAGLTNGVSLVSRSWVRHLPYIILAAFLSFALIVFLVFMLSQRSYPQYISKPLPQTLTDVEVMPSDVQPSIAAVESRKLNKWFIDIQDEFTVLTMQFNSNVHYVLDEKPENNSLVVTVGHTVNSDGLSGLIADGAIAKVVSQQNGNDLIIELKLVDGANLKSLTEENDIIKIVLRNSVKTKQEELTAKVESTTVKPIVKKIYQPLTVTEQRQQLYHEALAYANLAQYPHAIVLLKRTVARFPDYQEARTTLIMLLMNLAKNNAAEKVLHAGLKLAPAYLPFAKLEGQLLLQKHQPKQAIVALSKALATASTDTGYFALLAAAYKATGEIDMAAKLYMQLVKLQPTNSLWWAGLGMCLEELHKNNEAISAYQKALEYKHLKPTVQAYVSKRIRILGA